MRTLVPLIVWVACSLPGCVSDHGGKGKDGDEVNCGINAEPDGSSGCQCVGSYSWCEDGTDDCCAYDTNTFDVNMISTVIMPYKDAEDLEPWDWDGDVPDWLIEALDILSALVPEAATASEVANLVDEYAPELLEGTVPPDPFLEAVIGNSEDIFASTSTQDDTYDPWWDRQWRVTLMGSNDLNVWVYDEDLVFDDTVQGFYLDLPSLQWAAGRGEISTQQVGNLFEIVIAVEPVW